MSGPEGSIVQFDNVGLRYGTEREVLSDITFTLFPGSFYFLTGASGAGKTSLLKLLYLAQRPSRGMIRMFGSDVITLPRKALPAFRRRRGDLRRFLEPAMAAFGTANRAPFRSDGAIGNDIARGAGGAG